MRVSWLISVKPLRAGEKEAREVGRQRVRRQQTAACAGILCLPDGKATWLMVASVPRDLPRRRAFPDSS